MKLTAFLATAFFANTAAAYDQTCAAQCARFASTVEEYQTCLKGLCTSADSSEAKMDTLFAKVETTRSCAAECARFASTVEEYQVCLKGLCTTDSESVDNNQGLASKTSEAFVDESYNDSSIACTFICAHTSPSSIDDFNQCVKDCRGDDAITESKAESFVTTAENIVPLPGSGIFECQRQCDADFGKFIGEKLDCYDRCRSSDADTSSGDEAFLKESFNEDLTCTLLCAYTSSSGDDFNQCIKGCRSGSLAKTDTLTLKEKDTSTEFTSIPNCEEYCQNAYSFPHDIATCKRVVCSRGFEAASVKVASKKNLRGLSEDDAEVNAGNPVIKSSSSEEDTSDQLNECLDGCTIRYCIEYCFYKCRQFNWSSFC